MLQEKCSFQESQVEELSTRCEDLLVEMECGDYHCKKWMAIHHEQGKQNMLADAFAQACF